MKEIVVLAEKKNGNYRIRKFYPHHNQTGYGVEFNKPVVIQARPFPFETFSSVYQPNNDWEPCYLIGEIDIKDEKKWNNMQSGGIDYYTFDDAEFTPQKELETPFQYALDQYRQWGDKLGTYNLTTWLIHEQTRSEDEFNAMVNILKIALKKYENTPYTLDISFDKYVIPYMAFLWDKDVTFGRSGTLDTSDEMLKLLTLGGYEWFEKTVSKLQLYPTDIFIALDKSNYDEQIVNDYMYKNIGALTHGLSQNDWRKLAPIIHKRTGDDFVTTVVNGILGSMDSDDEVPAETDKDIFYWLSQDKVELITPEPRETYYCCYDCDGEPWWDEDEDDDLTPYDWRVNVLSTIVALTTGFASQQELELKLPYINKSVWKAYNES